MSELSSFSFWFFRGMLIDEVKRKIHTSRFFLSTTLGIKKIRWRDWRGLQCSSVI